MNIDVFLKESQDYKWKAISFFFVKEKIKNSKIDDDPFLIFFLIILFLFTASTWIDKIIFFFSKFYQILIYFEKNQRID
jgi:hypothetical protein